VHLRSVYGIHGVPAALHQGPSPSAPHAPWLRPHTTSTLNATTTLKNGAATKAHPAATAKRLAGKVKSHLLSQARGLPAHAHRLALDPAFDGGASFNVFSERIITASMQKMYKPDDVGCLLQEVGEEATEADVENAKTLLRQYDGGVDRVEVNAPRVTGQIRCERTVSAPVCMHGCQQHARQ
jgi:hypothetical protein